MKEETENKLNQIQMMEQSVQNFLQQKQTFQTQLKEIESYIAVRRETAGVFSRSVMKCRHRTLVQKGEGGNVSYSFPVCLEQGLKEVRSYARKKNVDTLPAFGHTVAAEADDDGRFPEARELMLRCLLFPCYPMLGKRNVEAVSRVLATLP